MVDLNTEKLLSRGNNLVDSLYELNSYNNKVSSKFKTCVIGSNIWS